MGGGEQRREPESMRVKRPKGGSLEYICRTDLTHLMRHRDVWLVTYIKHLLCVRCSVSVDVVGTSVSDKKANSRKTIVRSCILRYTEVTGRKGHEENAERCRGLKGS